MAAISNKVVCFINNKCILSVRCWLGNTRRVTRQLFHTRRILHYPCFKYPVLLSGTLFPVVHGLGFGWGKKTEQAEEGNKSTEEPSAAQLIMKADDLYNSNEILRLYDLLVQHKDEDNAEILWRLARAACDKGKMCSNIEDKKALIYEAFGYVKRALDLAADNFACNKWYAILLNYTGDYEGTKKKISNAYIVKEHLMKAVKLNPKDATSIHILGMWCFTFADLPWYQQKIASVVFATPPTSSYEEALSYFQEAENIDPNFYSTNLLMLGKTYLRLENKKLAYLYLTKARDYPVRTEDDKKAHKEAEELLQTLGMKEK